MTILQSWKDSVQLLKLRNLKLFLLVTFNSFRQGWRVLLNGYSLLFFLIGSMVARLCYEAGQTILFDLDMGPAINFLFIWYITNVFAVGLFFLWCLAIRPSVERKTGEYFKVYFKIFWYLIPLFAGIQVAEFLILLCARALVSQNVFVIEFLYGISIIAELLFCTKIFFMLFLFDGDGSMRSALYSIKRACKMSFYNLPLVLVISPAGGLVSKLYAFIVLYDLLSPIVGLPLLLNGVMYFVWYPLYICLLSNIYIKKLHEQFGLYFECPE